MLAALVLTVFPVLMIYAALSDVMTMTIANWVSGALIVGFFVVAAMTPMSWSAIGWNISCAIFVLAITFLCFARGWIGGGDAKLASATSLWIGWDNIDDYSVLFGLMGGLLTLVILMVRFSKLPSTLENRQWIVRLHNKANGVPYGLALAAAGLLVYPDTAVWNAAAIV